MNEKVSGRSIDVNRIAIYYEEHRGAAPLIRIHGGLASSTAWEPVVPQLAMASG